MYVILKSDDIPSPPDLAHHHELSGPRPVIRMVQVAHPHPTDPVLRKHDDVRPRLRGLPHVGQVLVDVEGEDLQALFC